LISIFFLTFPKGSEVIYAGNFTKKMEGLTLTLNLPILENLGGYHVVLGKVGSFGG
jgi:hypothetical protein